MSPTQDPIVELNNYLQSIGRAAALSWKDSQSGPIHNPEWKSVYAVSRKEYGAGTGTHKHLARGAAAEVALKLLKLEAKNEGDTATEPALESLEPEAENEGVAAMEPALESPKLEAEGEMGAGIETGLESLKLEAEGEGSAVTGFALEPPEIEAEGEGDAATELALESLKPEVELGTESKGDDQLD